MYKEKSHVGMTQCFFCLQPKDIILNKRLKDSLPRLACYDKEPCDKCKELMEMGIMLISVKEGSNKDNPYRTGKICVIKEEAAKKIFPQLGESRAAFVTDDAWKELGLPDGSENEGA